MPCSLLGRWCALFLAAAVTMSGVALAQDDPFGAEGDPFHGNPEPDPPAGADPFDDSPALPQLPVPRRMSADADVIAALEKQIDLRVVEAPLSDVVAIFADKAHINVDLDKSALEEVGIGSETPVTLSVKGMRLKSAVNHVLHKLDLVYTVRSGALVITTPEALEADLVTKAYPIDDLVDDARHITGEFDMDGLIEAVTSTIEPTTWEEVGGNGTIDELGKMLNIKQTFRAHQQTEQLLAALRKAHALTKKLAIGAGAPGSVPVDDIDDAAIRTALNKQFRLQFVETPLSDVVDSLIQATSINILIDDGALEEVGIGRDTPVTHDFRHATLASALAGALRELDLVWEIRDDALMLTTPEEAEYRLRTRIYLVLDLVQPESGTPVLDGDSDYDTLIELLTMFVHPTSWDEVGGPSPIETIGHGCIVLSQTSAGFAEVDAFLAAYRAALARTRKPAAADATQPAAIDDAEHAKLRTALQGHIDSLALGDVTLSDAATMLSQRLKLPVCLDLRLLEEYGVELASRVNLRLRNESLGDGLRRTLRPLELTWVLHCGTILVTPADNDASLLQTTRFYPVRDLVERPDDLELTSLYSRCDNLRRDITKHIAVNSWEEVGGSATMEFVQNAVMIVSQTEENHAAIADWLDGLRERVPPPNTGEPRVNASGERLFDKVYRLKSVSPNEATELAEIVQALVAPTSWRDLDVYAIRPAMKGGAIEIRHTAQTHRQVHQLFCELGVLVEGGAGLGMQAITKVAALALPPGDPANALDDALVVRVVRFDTAKPVAVDELIDDIRNSVARQSWHNGSAFIRPFRELLIIRHTPARQRGIAELLHDKGVLRNPPMLGGFSGFGFSGSFGF